MSLKIKIGGALLAAFVLSLTLVAVTTDRPEEKVQQAAAQPTNCRSCWPL